MTTETTTTNIFESIKVWINPRDGKEIRIYVKALDGREGCRYLTGNQYHAPKSNDGALTKEEWKAAWKLSYRNGSWNTMYFTPAPWGKKNVTAKPAAGFNSTRNSEDAREDIEAYETFRPRPRGESELYG